MTTREVPTRTIALNLAGNVDKRQSTSYVEAAELLAAYVLASEPSSDYYQAMLANLTATQTRCSELMLENQALKAELRRLTQNQCQQHDVGWPVKEVL